VVPATKQPTANVVEILSKLLYNISNSFLWGNDEKAYIGGRLRRRSTLVAGSISTALFILSPIFPMSAYALPGAHSTTVGNEVFLGGNYIELGLAQAGSFGTVGSAPGGFFGTAARSNIGMSTNPSGFGQTPDLRMDYFLPGSPRERWVAGYKKGGTPTIGVNAQLASPVQISNNTVTNMSSGSELKARSLGTLGGELQITQDISFGVSDKYFLNTVTLKNVGATSINSVRYARSFDPDNTRDQGGGFPTHNEVLYTQQAGDGKAVVLADTSNNNSDPVYLANGSRSPIVYYSSNPEARVSISNSGGFDGIDPYDTDLYDNADTKGTFSDNDIEINIAFDVGTLAPGQTKTVSFYTSLDNRDFTEVLEDIEEEEADDGDNIRAEVENAAPNSGDGNGDGVVDSSQSNVTSIPNSQRAGKYVTLESDGGDCDTVTAFSMKSEASEGTDSNYDYPVGLADFTLSCANPGDTSTITIYYDKEYDTSDWVARKYVHGAFTTIPNATFGTANVGGTNVTTLSYQVTDGGSLDADSTANGAIVDPAGPGVVLASDTGGVGAPNTGLGTQPIALFYGGIAMGVPLTFYAIRKQFHKASAK